MISVLDSRFSEFRWREGGVGGDERPSAGRKAQLLLLLVNHGTSIPRYISSALTTSSNLKFLYGFWGLWRRARVAAKTGQASGLMGNFGAMYGVDATLPCFFLVFLLFLIFFQQGVTEDVTNVIRPHLTSSIPYNFIDSPKTRRRVGKAVCLIAMFVGHLTAS